jgi:hypothetical protein
VAVLGRVARGEGDNARARALYEESLAICRETGQKEGIASALAALGDLDLVGGEVDSAQARCRESLALFSQLGYRRSIAAGLVGLARVAEARGQPERSARLLGAALALLDGIGTRLGAIERAEQERCASAVRAELGEEVFAAAWAEGRAMPLEQVIEYALAGTADG